MPENEKPLEKTLLVEWDGNYQITSCRRWPDLMRIVKDKPTVAFYKDHVQFGCIRISYEALRALASDADRARFMIHHKVPTPIILQEGTYEVRDPLGNVRKNARPAQSNSDVVVPSA